MSRLTPYLKKIASYPLTWIALAVVVLAELGFALWFEPSPIMMSAAVLLGIVALLLWPVILIRSPAFLRENSQREFAKCLEGCFPGYEDPAMDCWTVAERIKQEFGAKGFGEEVEAARAKLIKLTENHVKLNSLYERFGDEDQKKEMKYRIAKQVEHVELTRTSLLRLGGNIVLLETDAASREEIGAELRTINTGLEDAIREIDEIESYK